MKVTKTTKIDVSSEKNEIKKVNARIRVVNQLTAIKYKALGMEKPDAIKLIPCMTQDITRYGLTIRLSIESTGLVATTIIGKSKIVLFHDANTNLWLQGLYAGKGEAVNMALIDNVKVNEAVANISKSAKTIISKFNLGKMNTVKRVTEIRENCISHMDAVLPLLEEAEKALGIVEDTSINKNALPFLIKSDDIIDAVEVSETKEVEKAKSTKKAKVVA